MSMTPEQVDRMMQLLERIEQAAVAMREAMDRAADQREQAYRVIGGHLSDLRSDTSEILDEITDENAPGTGGGL